MDIKLALISAIGTLLSAIAASFSAFFAFRAVKKTEKVHSANLLSQLLTEYSKNDMLMALRELSNWREDNPKDFAIKYAELRKKRDKKGYDLDIHRRRVSHFF